MRAARGAAACALVAGIAACGGSTQKVQPSRSGSAKATPAVTTSAAPTVTTATAPAPPKPPPPPPHPQLLAVALGSGPATLTPAVRWHDQTAVWIERPPGAAVMVFDPRLTELHLHSGTIDAGTLGWRYGPAVGGFERKRLLAAFNGAFRLSTGAGGFSAYGREAAPLQPGKGSIVTYSDGSTDIGSWNQQVPAASKQVVSVRQNLSLLINHGIPSDNLGCVACWGATLGGVTDPARSALGITGDGRLVWAAGENLTVSQLVHVLLGAHAVRAVELDINPEWVAGYLYGHRGGRGPLGPVPALPAQRGIPGQFLAPWGRDFFTVVAR